MRTTIGVVFTAALTISGAAGVPAVAFPKPDRPVADIVSPIWHDEKERADAGEPTQVVRLLGIKPGMTVADIGAGSGYFCAKSWLRALRRSLRRGSTNVRRSCRGFARSGLTSWLLRR